MNQIYFFILLAVCLSQTAFSQKSKTFATPKVTGAINDYAQMLDAEAENSLTEKLDGLRRDTVLPVNIAVVTVKTLAGQDLFDVSFATARKWSVLRKNNKSKWLLIFIAKDDRKYFAQTSRTIEQDLSDATLGKIQRNFLVPAFRQEQYARGLNETVDAITKHLAENSQTKNTKEKLAFNQTRQPLRNVRQMLLVTTANWKAVTGVMQRFERLKANGEWRKVGDKAPIVIGQSGLAWGLGLHSNAIYQPDQPVKREGDGKAPAGVFKLTAAFGTVAVGEMASLKMPYTPLLESTECVDDVKSGKYNTIVDRYRVGFLDWTSSEKMLAVGEQYALGVVVAHNSEPVQKGNGSCIFLHVWKNAETGTSGCTAMERANIETILQWLDAGKNPILVQLPTEEYNRLRKQWKLPQNN